MHMDGRRAAGSTWKLLIQPVVLLQFWAPAAPSCSRIVRDPRASASA